MVMDKGVMLLLVLSELILKHGPDVAMKMIAAWAPENPTIEDWHALRVKDPADYFDA